MAKIVQPRLGIEYATTWEVAQIVLEHLSHAPDAPTFTIRRGEGEAVHFWFSKRTFDWLREVLNLDPRAHARTK